jgi:hypothetical protein
VIRRFVLWLAMTLPEHRFTPAWMAYGLAAKSYERVP